ncbi:unnamed protein product [Alopecurus aequalis]
MVDPVSLVGMILTVVQLIAKAASTARQNKSKCLELADRASTLANVLPNSTYAAANDMATASVLHKLKVALDEAFVLIQSCQTGSIWFRVFSRSQKATELQAVNGRINDCITDLKFIRDAHTHNGAAAAAGSVPAPTYDHGSYYQAQGNASSTYVNGYPAPQYATVNAHWLPGPSTASPAPPSGYSNLSNYCTLPTVNKFIDRVFR